MSTILLIGASPSPTSRSSVVLDEVAAIVRAAGHAVEFLELRQLEPAALVRARVDHADILEARRRLARADAVVIATPVYKASYSGLLKVFLDLLDRDALRHKLILPIATGGTIAHLLFLDYALRPVLCALRAEQILPGRFLLDRDVSSRGAERGITDPESRQRLQEQISELLAAVELSLASRLEPAA